MRVELPQVGESVTEAFIGPWLKSVGDRVEKYEPLVEVVTDKVTMELPSPATGVLSAIAVDEGQTVPMGTVIAEIEVEREEAEEKTERPAGRLSDPALIGTLLKDVAPVGPTGSAGPLAGAGAGLRYSPAVQRLAAEHGIDPAAVQGTGIGGRVTRKDIQAHVESRGSAAPDLDTAGDDSEERVPLTPIRRMIADNMARSATQIPEAWSTIEVDVTRLVGLRDAVRADFQRREGVNLTYMPFFLQAVAAALNDNPLVNSSWGGDAIVLKRRINIGVAIAAPQGLVVPVIHDAYAMDVTALARAVDDLATRARDGKLTVDDMQGGTFTVNNTGALGSVVGKGIINHPQAAILNTEAIVRRPVVVGDAVAVRSMMNLCITFDHRILDGAEAGAFVNAVKDRLEAIDPDTAVV